MRTPAPPNPELIRAPGPWVHRDLSVNGAQFHVVETGNLVSRDVVIFVHGFPQMWWAWRDVLAPLADADYRVVAMDLRGCGGSDHPPSGYDLFTLARDVIGVATSMSASRCLVVGHGLGGSVAWVTPALAPSLISAIMTIAAPHPLEMRTHLPAWFSRAALQYLAFQTPILAPWALRSPRMMRRLLSSWAGKRRREAVTSQATRYATVLSAPFAAETALRGLRELRVLSRDERRLLRGRVSCPVWSIRGTADRVVPPAVFARDADHASAPLRLVSLPGHGHFLPEEAPEEIAQVLADATATIFT